MRRPAPFPDAPEELIRARLTSPHPPHASFACLFAMGVLAVPGRPAAAQSEPPDTGAACPAGRVTHIFVDNHSIYDVDQVDDAGVLGWVYKTANALHVKTRESFHPARVALP